MLGLKFLGISAHSRVGLVIFVVLIASVLLTQFAVVNVRDLRSQAADCSSGQSSLTLRSTSNGHVTLWSFSPSSGTQFDKVDEVGSGDGDSSYIWDDTPPSNYASFGHSTSGLNQNTHRISKVTVVIKAKRTTGTQTYIEPGIIVGGAQYYGTKSLASTSYTNYKYSWANQPNGSAWTVSSLNSSLIAARSSRPAQPNELRITQMYMEVCYYTPAPPPPPPPPPPPSVTPPPSAPPPSTPPPAVNPPSSSPPAANPAVGSQVISVGIKSGENNFLIGSKELTLSVKGNDITKKIVVNKSSSDFTLDFAGLEGRLYTLRVEGEWMLLQEIPFVLGKGVQVKLNPLRVGDVNGSSSLEDGDIFEFLNGFISDKFYDLNADGVVNSIDYSLLVGNF